MEAPCRSCLLVRVPFFCAGISAGAVEMDSLPRFVFTTKEVYHFRSMIWRSSLSSRSKTLTPSVRTVLPHITADAPQSKCRKTAAPESTPPHPTTSKDGCSNCRRLHTLARATLCTTGPPTPNREEENSKIQSGDVPLRHSACHIVKATLRSTVLFVLLIMICNRSL